MEENDKYDCLKLENQLCFPLYAASREVLKKYTPLLKELNLTYTQYIVMMVLWSEKEISIKELCRKLFLDTGTLSPLLKAMEEKNLLTRTRQATDERVVTISITPQGEALREQALSVPEEMGKCISLTSEEATALYKLLYKILG